LLTWGADEHILCALAAGWWLFCRSKGAAKRHASDHILVTTLVAFLRCLHILKVVFDQERPDRTTIRGHWRGIPFSGKRLDAFPSGHAVHIGALASAASVLSPKQRNLAWGLGGALVLTRIVLACALVQRCRPRASPWAVFIERLIRQLTGYGRSGKNAELMRDGSAYLRKVRALSVHISFDNQARARLRS